MENRYFEMVVFHNVPVFDQINYQIVSSKSQQYKFKSFCLLLKFTK